MSAANFGEEQASILRWIFDEFADGLSSIAIARGANEECSPDPRIGEWNASSIRGGLT